MKKSTKKTRIKTPKITSIDKVVSKQFVVRYHDIESSIVHYWSDSGHGFTTSEQEATRFSKNKAILKLGELLHENKLTCELVEVTTAYESPVQTGTVVLNTSRNVAELIIRTPTIKNGALILVSCEGTRELEIQSFINDIIDGDLDIIWDSSREMIPKDNADYLQAHGLVDVSPKRVVLDPWA